MTIKMSSREHDIPPGRAILEETIVRLKKGDPSALIPHDGNIPATPRVLAVDPQKCNGCKLCEIACSLFHDGEVDPARSRIHVLKWLLWPLLFLESPMFSGLFLFRFCPKQYAKSSG